MANEPDPILTVQCLACGKPIAFDPRRFKRNESFEMGAGGGGATFSLYVPCPHCKVVNQIRCEE